MKRTMMNSATQMSVCTQCKVEKPLTYFYARKASLNGKQGKCKQCASQWAKEHKAEFRVYCKNFRDRLGSDARYERNRKYKLKQAFGLSLEDYDQMVKDQNGLCAICHKEPNGKWKTLHVDHDHETDRIRGLLCSSCNMAIGLFEDDLESMQRALDYVRNGGVR